MSTDPSAAQERRELDVIVSFLRKIDQHLLVRIARRLINYLSWSGVREAQDLLQFFSPSRRAPEENENRPSETKNVGGLLRMTDEIFQIAREHMTPDEILRNVQKWIKDDKSGFLVEAVENQGTSLSEITQFLERYEDMAIDDRELSRGIQVGLRVSLVRRFLTEELDFIDVAKNVIAVGDFYDLVRHVISPPSSHGKLGGKGAGLFLAARILQSSPEVAEELGTIRTPKTWYVTSDGVLDFLQYNNLEDVYNRKYLQIDQVREEYPHLVQVFKSSHFSPEIIRGLSLALDDFEGRPIIVRSSSLLEDRLGSAFSGKYKSLFLANEGTKRERLLAVMDAIAEVYASVFGPDPIEYRSEKGLLDVHEEMGIMLQEVVGTKVGRYFFPSWAGVAFSNNEFRWSSRIRREDGLVRLVPGLGTRAVDRVGDDYPVLVAPGQPGLRVNVTKDEIVRYAPRFVDVINLESRKFETIAITDLLKECGSEIPGFRQIVSVCDEDGIHRPLLLDILEKSGQLIITFDGLVSGTPFLQQMRTILHVLREKMGCPVDIEFASDGKELYLLQCRPQSFSDDAMPAPIPRDLPPERILFSAHKYVSNGSVPDLTHIVYVDPDRYADLPDVEALRRVGRAVSRLNKVLPKRKFLLVGPGRWGSRGDIKLGVNVTYSDINNTAALVEVARKQGNYVPDVSFGTHFFQDLVEASIRYLPLFPDEEGNVFNEEFLRGAPDVFTTLVPEFADLEGVVRAIDVPKATGGLVLKLLLNAEQEEAAAVFSPPGLLPDRKGTYAHRRALEPQGDDHARWRLRMAERVAVEADAERFGIRGLYVLGSTKNGTAGPDADIDLLLHFRGTPEMRHDLELWLEGWSLCLAEMNFLRTGIRVEGLLDVEIVTDDEIRRQAGHAGKIGAVTDAARPLVLKQRSPKGADA